MFPGYQQCLASLSTTPPPHPRQPPGVLPTRQITVEPQIRAPESHLPAGAGSIDNLGCTGFPETLICKNEWFELRDGKLIHVYAVTRWFDENTNAELPRPWQGELDIGVTSPDGKTVYDETGFYPLPSRTGVIQIVDAVGEQLVINGEDGSTYYFDVSSRKFVSSVNSTAPKVATPVNPAYP